MYPTIGYLKKNEFDFKNNLFPIVSTGNLMRLSGGAMQYFIYDELAIQYANTTVFAENSERVELRTNGHYSNTTKKWINRGLENIGAYIFQKNFKWFISQKDGSIIDFKEGTYNLNCFNGSILTFDKDYENIICN